MMERDYLGPDSRQVQQMFAAIAHRYDLLNHFLSVSVDRHWRRAAATKVRDLVGPSPELCLDVCCGTGDLALALHRFLQTQVIASDFCHPMLIRAGAKFTERNIRTIEGDALQLPFPDACFDAVTIAFGLRNLEDPYSGLREIHRVLKPRGATVILEFSKPVVPVFSQVFNFYFRHILPLLGAIVSGNRCAYQYLPDSVGKFPNQEQLLDRMRQSGFVDSGYRNLSGGIAALHWGRASSERQ
jgi:demethylmenaquinone methyltransferase / 2-methoxy-6-polyprenyl-1,4-benzoquinol methylase